MKGEDRINRILSAVLRLASLEVGGALSLLLTLLIATIDIDWYVKTPLILAVWIGFAMLWRRTARR